ncbi:hypothetical protein PO909_031236 [Leuciscus waleckii]
MVTSDVISKQIKTVSREMSFSASIWDFKINKRFEHLLFLPPRWLLLQNGGAHLEQIQDSGIVRT